MATSQPRPGLPDLVTKTCGLQVRVEEGSPPPLNNMGFCLPQEASGKQLPGSPLEYFVETWSGWNWLSVPSLRARETGVGKL